MEFLIISGMSGAGKSRVAAILEDMDFYCVDNMPVVLMPKFAELCLATVARYERVALVTDVRGKNSFDELFAALDQMQDMGCAYKILYVEASLPTIVKRYKETRRRHPLDAQGRGIEAAVEKEQEMLRPVRERADYVIDTTGLKLRDLQGELYSLFEHTDSKRKLRVTVESFGFKYGIPIDADLVFDVRFLPNPFYVNALRNLTGQDAPVRDYVFSHGETEAFMKRLTDMVDYLLPLYQEEGKHALVIAIGCTGGRHRSVAIAGALAEHVEGQGYPTDTLHRDVEK